MITIKNVTLRRSAKVLLEGATVTLNPGEKVGLVGRNGAGKSSLFALLNGNLQEDSGEFYIPTQWRMGQVAQDMPETEQSATEFVIEGDTVLNDARAEVKAAEATEDGERLGNAYMALYDAGEHDAQSRAQALILGLGFKTTELDNPVNSFSGGWRMRLQLARALMCPSDLLLLDEPTNHLDLDALVWLEAWLKRYEGTMVVISHDREFLDAVTNVTLHIDHGKLVRYGGNYSKFEDMRAEQMELQQNAFAKQQDKIAHLQKFIARFKAKASKAKQAQSRVKALDRMEKIAPLLADADFSFEFKEPANLPNPMLSMQGVSVGYPAPADAPAGTPPTVIVQNVSRSVLAGQRIGILGANGQGKSTLVKTIARDLQAIGGDMTEGKGLNIGYFAQQELDVLRDIVGPQIGVTSGAAALTAALDAFGAKNVAAITPYQPVGDVQVRRFLEESGYNVTKVIGLKCDTATSIAHTPPREVIDTILSELDGQDVDAIVQAGTNLSGIDIFPTLEKQLGKPVIPINVATIWHALRAQGVDDKIYGRGWLMERF